MGSRRVTIRAKLYVAILLTVLGPVITIAVALHGMNRLGDRFDEVQDRAARQALALDLKFGVTDFNGWQTAYGYDNGASRGRFTASVREFRADLAEASRELTDPPERRHLRELSATFEQFMRLDDEAFQALQRGDGRRVKQIFLGPELKLFDSMAAESDDLARYESRRDNATETAFDDSREDARRGLIAVALGAALVIILLLVTASDIARMAVEGGRRA
jgi:methyl-accepting chemotaxis protein